MSHVVLQERQKWQKGVVYYDQLIGALHAVRWSNFFYIKLSFSVFLKWQPCHFPVMAFCFVVLIYLNVFQ